MTADSDKHVREGLSVLEVVARRTERRLSGLIALDELMSIGRLALLDVVRNYDPERARFAPYCAQRLQWALLDGVRRHTHGRSVARRARALSGSHLVGSGLRLEFAESPAIEPTQEAHEARLGTLLATHAASLALGLVAALSDVDRAADPSPTPEERVAQLQFGERMRRFVVDLPDRERQLVERHYFGDEPFETIARDLGISKSWASRLHAQAIKRLARQIGDEP